MAHADIVVGLGFGDEAKGSTVDALAARTRPDRVVRFNGGQQAGHNVTVGQVHHTFASFGSATLLGVPTWVSGHCTIDPPAAHRELQALRRLGVDPQLFVTDDALVTTTWHVAANLARETARGATPHGTTGRGFGETVDYSLTHPAWAPRVGDLDDLGVLTDKLTALAKHYAHQGLLTEQPPQRSQVLADELATAAKNTLTVVSTERLLDELARGHTLFEGAQGYWLDECFGFQPHTTWSTTTPANARALARDAGITDVRTIGCLRTYATRHGAGPFPGEDTLTHRPPEAHNADTDTAGTFRTGAHDPALVRAAVDTAMPDVLAVSHLDMFARIQTTDGPVPVDAFGTVVVTATGPSRHDRHFAHTPR